MTTQQYKIRFSFTVNYDDTAYDIKNNVWCNTGKITGWKDQPFNNIEIQEEAYNIAKRKFYDSWGYNTKINSISCYSFIKEEQIETLDFEIETLVVKK